MVLGMNSYVKDIVPWFSEGLAIRLSKIHGKGLFAINPFCPGTILIRLGGFLFPNSERRSDKILPSTTTPLTEEVFLAEPSFGEKDYSDYLNHSCQPNVGFFDAITVVTVEKIKPGDEILIDYAFWEIDSKWFLRSSCNCGSRNCRHIVSGEDWKKVKVNDYYFEYYSPFIKRKILQLKKGVYRL